MKDVIERIVSGTEMNKLTPAELGSANPPEVVAQMRWVSRYFDHDGLTRALTNVSFDVFRGEVFGLVGSAGSGKSTLIRILAGRLSPSEGKVKVFGRRPKRRATRARVGYLPQHAPDAHSEPLSDALAFLKDIFWFGKSGKPGRQPAAPAVRSDPRNLLRQILVKKPELVMLDDPFAGLEPETCDEVLQFIRKLKQLGRTVIISARSLSYLKEICDRLGVLRRGQVEAIGTLPDLLTTPDGLYYVSDVLPQATAERILSQIRQELGVGEPSGSTASETGIPNAPDPNTKALSTTDKALLPLVKNAELPSSLTAQPAEAVDHEMLAALTRNRTEVPPKDGQA